jgi:hypothetical protein
MAEIKGLSENALRWYWYPTKGVRLHSDFTSILSNVNTDLKCIRWKCVFCGSPDRDYYAMWQHGRITPGHPETELRLCQGADSVAAQAVALPFDAVVIKWPHSQENWKGRFGRHTTWYIMHKPWGICPWSRLLDKAAISHNSGLKLVGFRLAWCASAYDDIYFFDG